MDKWEKLLVDIYAEVSKINGILTGGNGSGLIQQVQNHEIKIDHLEKDTAKIKDIEKANTKIETLETITVKKDDVKDGRNRKRWVIGFSVTTLVSIVGILIAIFKN